MPKPASLFATLLLSSCLGSAGLAGGDARAQGETRQGQFSGALPTEYPAWFKESFLEFAEDVAEAAAAGRRLMVLFHQDGCPYCNRLVEVNLAQKDIEDYLREHFDVVAVNMWGDREVVTVGGKPYTEKTFAAALRVQFTPTILFFDERGKVALRLNGYLPPGEFKTSLRYVAERRETETGYREWLERMAPAPASGSLNAQPFFRSPPHDLRRGPGARPLAVFFEQRECPNCDRLHGEVLADPETRRLIGDFDAVQLDLWSSGEVVTPDGRRTTARAWAKELGVHYAPSIVLFDAEGREVIRSEAMFKAFHTQSLFDYVAGGGHRHEPSFQRYISERADRLIERGKDVDLWR